MNSSGGGGSCGPADASTAGGGGVVGSAKAGRWLDEVVEG